MGKAQSKQSIFEVKDANYMRFALVGSSGSGKSAFVNAVRGIDDEGENAATVDIVDTGQSPKEYIYPSHPQASFCDMPGYGTPSDPDLINYWEKYQLEKFDTFFIFISNRVTALDLAMIQKVKSLNKSFFLIRPKIDLECKMKEHEPNFKEEELLSKIKQYIVKKTDHLLCNSEDDIFLVSNYYPYNEKWEFLRLIQVMINIMPAPYIDTTSDLTEQYLADAKMYVKANGVKGIEEYLTKKLEGSKEVKIRFAITGDSGTGKSAFINAIRGLKDDDDGAAKVDVVETTTEATEYQHPDNPKITFVDLPGIGTPNYPKVQTYCEKVGLEEYDTFLIFTETRFTQNDLYLAEKVKSIGKSFFLVRTKIDNDCMPMKQKKPINEAEILEKIRKNCMDNVKNLISSEQGIFLISNYNKDKWDFDRLIEAISDALPVLQRECLTLSLSNVTRNCLRRKARFFKAQAAAVAIISAGTGAIPIPGVGGVMDTVLIAGTITTYYRGFGLYNTTTKEIGLLDKKCRETIKRYQFRSVAEFTSTIATKKFGLMLGVEEVSKFIPIIGIVIAGSISFVFTLRYLLRSITELEEAAIAVWDNAAKKSGEDNSSNTSTGFAKEIITTDGAVLKIDDITLKIGAGCVAKDTEITMMINYDQNAFKSLLSLGLIDAVPPVVKFHPDGTKFLKPVDITIGLETMSIPDSQPFVLYSYYDSDYSKTVWELANIPVEDKREKGVVNLRINELCLYSLILAKREKLARILSHLNHSFNCRAYAFYRRLPSMDTIDIAVVILSEFVDEREEDDIKQLKDHLEQGFVEGAKGMIKRIRTDHRLQICLDFPGVESGPLLFKIDEPELNKDGFLIDHFKRINIRCPASGMVEISQVDGSAGSQLLWGWDVRENPQEIERKNDVPPIESDPESKVVHCRTKFTNTEKSQLGLLIGTDWDELAGLMNIPYSMRDEIRVNDLKYPDSSLKAEQVFAHFNSCEHSCRHHLEKYLNELGRGDLKNKMLPMESENATKEVETLSCPLEAYENERVEDCTPLSSREMFRLSQRITTDWDSFAGLVDIAKEQRDDIRLNTIYKNHRARAEKILSIFNQKENFSRKKLADCFTELRKLELIEPVTTGKYRKV